MPAAIPFVIAAVAGSAVSVAGTAVVANQNRIAGERASTKAKEANDKLMAEKASKDKKMADDAATLENETENQRQARTRQKGTAGSNRESTILGSATGTPDAGGTMLGGSGLGGAAAGGKTLLGS